MTINPALLATLLYLQQPSRVAQSGFPHVLSTIPSSSSLEFLDYDLFTEKLNEFILSFHSLNLSLVFGLVFLDAGSSSIFGRALEEFTVVHGVLGELSSMWFFAVVVKGSIGVVEFSAGRFSTSIKIVLALLFGWIVKRVHLGSSYEL